MKEHNIPTDFFFGKDEEKEIFEIMKHNKDDWRVIKSSRNYPYWDEGKEIKKLVSRQSAIKFIKEYIRKQK